MRTDHSPLVRISASAGSGKTYALTRRFLDLLRGARSAEAQGGCALSCPDRGYALPEILAATFTNKAAAEMKQRVISALKEEALRSRGSMGAASDSAAAAGESRAEEWVNLILRHYGALNIRTIDSLLSTMVRLSALELRLPPDFELYFTPEEYFTPLYDALMDDLAREDRENTRQGSADAILPIHEESNRADTVSAHTPQDLPAAGMTRRVTSCEAEELFEERLAEIAGPASASQDHAGRQHDHTAEDASPLSCTGSNEHLRSPQESQALFLTSDGARLRACLREACLSLLRLDIAKGFTVGPRLHDSLHELVSRLMAGKSVPRTDSGRLHAELHRLLGAMNEAAKTLRRMVMDESLSAQKNFLSYLDSRTDGSAYVKPKDSVYSAKPDLDSCLNKSSKGTASANAELAFFTLQAAEAEFSRAVALLRPALQLAPLVELAHELYARMEAAGSNDRLLPLARVPLLARQVLSAETGVSDALCRLGSRLTHLLLDEFQDTSLEQWQAILPLAVECLATNGSLTYVGDVKQAIYSWRGGETALFETAAQEPELTAIAGQARLESLQKNWRSRPEVVAHNNAFFALLAEADTARRIMAAMLPSHTPLSYLDQAARDCVRIFCDAQQLVPSDEEKGLGREDSRAKPGSGRADAAPGLPAGQGGTAITGRANEERQPGVRLYMVDGPDKEAVENAVYERLKPLFMEELFPARKYGDVAVLVRSATEAGLMAEWLTQWRIPVVTENSFLLREHPLVNRLAALLTFLDYPLDDLAFWEFISGEECFCRSSGLNPADLTNWLADAVRTRGKGRPPLFMLFRESWPEAWNIWLAPFHNQAGLMSAYDMLLEAMNRFRLFENYPEQAPFLRRFLEIAHLAETRGASSLASFLSFWKDAAEAEKLPLPESMNAVRILTTHKAKGLEFPVVVLPFHHQSRPGDPELTTMDWNGMEILTRAVRELEDQYYGARITEELERLNLLYVAWTRPVEELHAFITRPARRMGSSSLARGLDVLLERYRDKHGDDFCHWETLGQEDGDTGEASPETAAESMAPFAETPAPEGPALETSRLAQAVLRSSPEASPEAPPAAPGEKAPPEEADTYWRPMGWLPRLKIYRSTLSEAAFTPARRGTLAHLCLEHLLLTRPADASARAKDVDRAVRMGMRLFPLPVERPQHVALEMRECLGWFAALPQAAHWLRNGRREQALMDAQGALHRADLLVEEPHDLLLRPDAARTSAPDTGVPGGSAILRALDYKTGHAPEEHPQYHEQVRRYMGLLAGAQEKPVRGVLVFLDERRMEEVQP